MPYSGLYKACSDTAGNFIEFEWQYPPVFATLGDLHKTSHSIVRFDWKWKNLLIKSNKRVAAHLCMKGHCTEVKHMVFHLQNSYSWVIPVYNNAINPSNGYHINSWNKFIFAIFQTKLKYSLIQNHVSHQERQHWNEGHRLECDQRQ